MKRGLFVKYVTLFVGLVAVVGVINAALDLYFVYQDNRRASIDVQREKAAAAAQTIESFIKEIERQIGWVAYAQFDALPADQRRFDYVRLLRQVPAITELAQLDRTGHEQLHVSRLSMDVVGSNQDRSAEPAFVEAKANKVYYGPVYFRKGSEPYLTMAVAHGGRGGVTVADVNLKLILDVISQIRIGKNGYAYVIDRQGRLVAHPDISLVLRGTDMSKLAQVESALKQPANGIADDNTAADARNRNGVPVLSAHAVIQSLDWIVFVELPISEAQQPVINSGLRDLALLVLGLLIAGAAAALLARRMVIPIRSMQASAQRIGSGDLGHRMSIRTGDELEALANQFNRSAGALQESYETLEQRVEDRTAELRESLDQQTATAEILRVISQSPTDVRPVLDVVVRAARRFCGADDAMIVLREGSEQLLATHQGALPSLVGSRFPLDRSSTTGRATLDGRTIHVPDVADLDPVADAMTVELTKRTNVHALLAAPMLREGIAVGCILLRKPEPGAFTARQIELLETFAAQAVIAIENVRLFTELRESLDQQTATAEILGIINASPGDVAPVFDAILEKAMLLCQAAFGTLHTYDGQRFHIVAALGVPERFAEYRRSNPVAYGPETSPAQLIAGAPFVHIADAAAGEAYKAGEPNRRAIVELGGARTLLNVPLRKDDAVLGMIAIYRQEVRPFTDKQIALLQGFAAQAVITMENARLLTEQREALEQQTATADVLRVISQSPTDVQPVLRAVAAAARRFCGADDATIVLREGRELLQVAHDGELALVADARFPFDRSSTIGHSVIDARTIHIPDAASLAPSEYALTKALSREVGVRALLAAPMLREDGAIGCILLRRPEPGAFTPRQVELLETFASQAVIAIENVRLFTELRESLEQQTATAEILRVISQSPTDVNPVLKAVARAALRFCGAEDVLVALRDNDDILVEDVALDGSEPIRRPLIGQLENRRAILDGSTIHHPDVQALDRTEFAENYASAEKFGYRSVVAAPMLREGAAIGSILLSKAKAGPFTPRQIELLEAFAAQAVIAIENVRLFTEIQEKGRQLEVASQHKSQFLANMSHELRTPLNAILGYTEMMVDGLYGDLPEKAQGVLERVQSNGKHLLGLINDVLDLSKIEAGQLSLAVEEYSVPDMVSTVMSATESLAKAKGIGLIAALPEGLPRGHGDARRLTQVLLNLVGNAIKFTDEGKVEIRARQQGDRFKISVIDTGPGIAKADQAKIFEEFQQVDNTSTRKKGGTGLGLSISRKIVELHGGYITVESDVGKGSNFKITIPINAEPAKEAAQ